MRSQESLVGFRLTGVVFGQKVEAAHTDSVTTMSPLIERRAQLLVELQHRVGSPPLVRTATLEGNLATVLATIIRACDEVMSCDVVLGAAGSRDLRDSRVAPLVLMASGITRPVLPRPPHTQPGGPDRVRQSVR